MSIVIDLMAKITISLSKEDEKILREKAKKNFRSISGEISYLLHKIYSLEKE